MDNKEYVTLTVDDEQIRCEILVVLEAESKEYIAVLPVDENGEELYDDGEVWLYRFKRDKNGFDHKLYDIQDDDEFDLVSDKFDEWLDTQEFEEATK